MKISDLEPNALVEIEITNHFESMERAQQFPADQMDWSTAKIGPPEVEEGQLLGVDEWGRYTITKRIIPRH